MVRSKTYTPKIIQNPNKTEEGHFIVDICGDEYQMCINSSGNFWANEKEGGEWDPGLISVEGDEHKPVRTGLLVEVAFAKLFGVPVNFEYSFGGVANDFSFGNLTVDTKCARYNYGAGLIRAEDEWGRKTPLVSDVYAFGYIIEEDRVNLKVQVALVGSIPKEDVEGYPIKKARKGKHKNYDIPYKELIPIQKWWERKDDFLNL